MQLKQSCIIIISIFFLFALTACNSSSNDIPNPEKTNQPEKINLNIPVLSNNISHRVIATYRPATHIVLALGKMDSLVGVQDNGGGTPLFMKVHPRIESLPYVGSKVDGLNIETIVSLKPSLVILYPGATKFSIAEKLQKFGIESFYLGIENFSEMQQTIQDLGKKLQAEVHAQKTIDEMQRIFRLVQTRLEKFPPAKKKRIYITNSYNFLITHSQKMLQHEMITKAGCEDASTAEIGGWATISFEQLLVWNPDIIVVSGAFRQDLNEILQEPQYQNLQAIQKRQLYRMPHQKLTDWDYPGPDSVLGVLWLALLAYPDAFQGITFEDELEQYHQKLYGISIKEMIR